MVPTLAATLGVKGHRPAVGTRDCKDLLHVFGAVNCVDGRLHTRTLATRASVLRAQQNAVQIGRETDVTKVTVTYSGIGLIIDNAPWHRGRPVADALADNPHLELYRLPSYSPQLNVIERVWKWLRRRATHNRLFDTLADLRAAVRDALRHLQRVPRRVLALLGDAYEAKA